MSEDLACTLAIIVAFLMGYWNGWVWRYLVARRRLRETQHNDGGES